MLSEIQSDHPILDLAFQGENLFTDAQIPDEQASFAVKNNEIMEKFFKQGAILPMIHNIIAQMDQWKNKTLAKIWRIYLQDIISFINLGDSITNCISKELDLFFALSGDVKEIEEDMNQSDDKLGDAANQYPFGGA